MLILYINIVFISLSVITGTANAKQLISSWDQMILVGGFTVPATTINTKTMKYSTGSFDKRPGTNKWIAQHSDLGRIVEYSEPSEPNMTFPALIPGRSGYPFTTVDNYYTKGVQWIDSNQVLCVSRLGYGHGAKWNWVSIWNLDTGVETLQTVGHVDDSADWAEGSSANKLFHLTQMAGGGLTRIPSDWANANVGGRTIGMMAGGRNAQGSPNGPAGAAFAIGDTLPITLLDYPTRAFASDDNHHYEIRDKNYSFPAYGPNPPYTLPRGDVIMYNPIYTMTWHENLKVVQEDPLVWGPAEDHGVFGNDDVSAGAGWIDSTSYKGVVFGVTHPNGYLDYDTQIPSFLVIDPAVFYDNSVSHWQHPIAYAGGPKGYYSRRLYVYDPDCLANVAAGTTKEWECSPTIITPDFSNLPATPVDNDPTAYTKIGGVFWDNDRQYLWLILTRMSSGNSYPMLVAYKFRQGKHYRYLSISDN